MTSKNSCTRFGIIMAGGSGERFWPLSRRNHPKQLLKLTRPDQTMLGEAVERLSPLIPANHIYIVTGAHLVAPIREANVGVPAENVLAEPCKRNTSGCLAYAAAHLIARYGPPETLSMAVVTADHIIGDPKRFRDAVQVALETVESADVLATQGIVPNRPETGYGYIQIADPKAPIRDDNDLPVFPVAAFHEKPNREIAEDFVNRGGYLWNSGMFFWRVSTFLAELDRVRPELAQATRDMADAIHHNDKGTVNTLFESLEDISIDYALMEHAKNAVVVRADYPWDDVGTWTSLDRTRDHDAHGNVADGDPVLIDSHNSIVVNAAGPGEMAVSVVGMDNVVVVACKDGVLVIPKDRAQDVRKAVAELKARGAKQV